MADYDLLYQDTYIDALLATANELKTAGYIYKGVATPSTNPGTPTERVAYLASEPGTYTNFGGIVIASGLYSLTYASGTWTGTQMSAGSDIEVVQTTGDSTTDVMSQKAVTDELYGFEQIPITSLELHSNQWIYPTPLIYQSKSNYAYRIMQVSEGETIKIVGGNVNAIHLAFLNTFNPVNNSVADIVQYNGNSIFYLNANATQTYLVPANAHYMYILYYINGQARTPSYIGKQYSIINDLQNNINVLINERDAVDISIYDKTAGAMCGDGTFDTSETAYELCRYDVNGLKYIYVKNELGRYANYVFSTSASMTNAIAGTMELCAIDKVLAVPVGAKYILINHRIAGNNPVVKALSENYGLIAFQTQKRKFHPIKCMELPWYRNMAIGFSGKYIFATKDNGVCKIDAGIESQPEVGSVIAAHGSDFSPWGAAVNDDYLYLVTRNMGSGENQLGNSSYGGFLDIIKISTWEVVNTISYPVNMTTVSGHNCYFGKSSGVATYGNYLCVAMNLEGFKLYNITNKENPTQIGNVDTKSDFATYYVKPSSEKDKYGATEYQTCRFYLDSIGNLRLAMVGYGYNFLEIYDPTSSISSRSNALCTVLYSDINYINIKAHTKGVAINYPYIYNTIGAWPNYVTSGNRQVGIIVTDISNLSSPQSKMVLLPANDMTSSYVIEGSPYSLTKAENHIIMDNYGKGYAVFDITDPANPLYVGLFGTPYTSEVDYTEDGRLICTGACSAVNESTIRPPITIWRGL